MFFPLITELQLSPNRSLVLATVWIITQVFNQKSRSPVLIGQYANSRQAYMEQKDIIEGVVLRIFEEQETRLLLEVDKVYESNYGSLLEFYENLNDDEYFYQLGGGVVRGILFVDGMESFQKIFDDFLNDRNHFYRNGFYCIVYTGRESDRLKIIRTMFRRLFRIYVINVNVLVSVGSTVYVYTYYPFTTNQCHNAEPYFHGIFGPITNYVYSRKKFFPKKLLNMWKCTIVVTTWNEAPFMKINYNGTTGDVISLDGIEGNLLFLLSERMNFTIKIAEDSGRNTGHGNEGSGIRMLAEGLTNITIGGLIYDKLRQEIAQPSYSYLHVPVVFAIPLGKIMSPFTRLIRPFKYIIWSCLSFSLLFGIIIIYLFKGFCSKIAQKFLFGAGFRTPFTNILNVFFGGPISGVLPRRNFARYLLALFAIYTSIMRNAYLAQLFLILQDSRPRSTLTTVDKLLAKNITFYTYHVIYPILVGATKNPIKTRFLENRCISLSNLMNTLGQSDEADFTITHLGHIIHAYNQNISNFHQRVNILEEPLISSPITFYMRKHSYLVHEINELLLNIMSAGLVRRFEDLSLTNRDFNVGTDQEPAPLSLSIISGLFAVHFVLLMLSTAVFLLELWSKHSPLTRRVINFLNF